MSKGKSLLSPPLGTSSGEGAKRDLVQRSNAHSVIAYARNSHDGNERHLRAGNGPRDVAKATTRTGVPKKMVGEIGEDNRSRNAEFGRAFDVFLPALQCMQIQCTAKRCRDGEQRVAVPAVHSSVTAPYTDPVLRKETNPPIRLGTEQVHLVMRAGR